MFKQLIKDYLSFTKKERVAVTVLLTLIVILFVLPHLGNHKKPPVVITAMKNVQEELKRGRDSAHHGYLEKRADLPVYAERENTPGNVYTKRELFYFDPNVLSAEGWKRLGLAGKTVTTIQHYLSKGGRFRKKEDISKIYGLRQKDVERLLPYVRLQEEVASAGGRRYEQAPYPHPGRDYKKPESYETIDLNAADTTSLIALPGIGSRLADRITRFREKLGGFYEADQLKEVYGLPDSTFQLIRSRLYVSGEGLRKININAAAKETLKEHPYIRWNVANAIVQYRMQHGNFKSADDIQFIAIISPELKKKLLPYLKVE